MVATAFTTASCNKNANAFQPGDDTAEEVYADESSKNLTSDPDAEITITAFKCGKADAFLLRTANHTVVIDTATDKKGDNFLELIDEQGIDTIDDMIITHFDQDHVGGADQIIKAKNVGKIYTTYLSKNSDDIGEYYKALKEKGYKDLIVKDVYSFKEDGVVYTIYPPEAMNYKSSVSNNSSLAIMVQCGDKTGTVLVNVRLIVGCPIKYVAAVCSVGCRIVQESVGGLDRVFVRHDAKLLNHQGIGLRIADQPYHEVDGRFFVRIGGILVDSPAVFRAAVQAGLFLTFHTAIVRNHGGIGDIARDGRILPRAVYKEGCLAGFEFGFGIVSAGGQILRVGQAVVDAEIKEVLIVFHVVAGKRRRAFGPDSACFALFIDILEVNHVACEAPAGGAVHIGG